MIAVLSLLFTLLLRYEGYVPDEYAQMGLKLAVIAVFWRPAVNFALGTYRQVWRYTGVPEIQALGIASVLGSCLFLAMRVFGILAVPYSVIIIDTILFFLGAAGVRVLRRRQVAWQQQARQRGDSPRSRTLFVGAGDSAESLLRDLERDPAARWEVVGLLDDDSRMLGMQIHGSRVLGPTPMMERVVRELQVEQIVVAMPEAEPAVTRDLIRRAQRLGTRIRVVPHRDGIGQMPQGGGDGAPLTAPNGGPKLGDLVDSAEIKRTLIHRLQGAERDKRVLVTGGGGYIGNFLVERLLAEGYSVRVLDNFTFGLQGLDRLIGHPRLEVIEGDISSIRDVVRGVKDVRSVVALAAIVGDPACGLDAEETLTLNYESSKILIEASNFYGVERLVFASSCSVYGASDTGMLDETSPLNPVSLYARTRIMSENVIFDRCGDVSAVVLRLATVFGLSARMRFDLVVNTLTARGVVDGQFEVFGGNQWRPFVHCRDAAEAFLAACIAPASVVSNEIFNVGGNDLNYTISDVGEIVAGSLGNVQVANVGEVDDPRNYRVSFDKIRSRLGFVPSHGIEHGVAEIADAIRRSEAMQDYRNPIYSNFETLRNRLALV